MAQFRSIGFTLGGLGLLLFAGGLAYAFLAPTDLSCGANLLCQKRAFELVQGRVLFLWVAASVLLLIGGAMLYLHLRDNRGDRAPARAAPRGPARPPPPVTPRFVSRPPPATPPPAPRSNKPPPGPEVTVRRK